MTQTIMPNQAKQWAERSLMATGILQNKGFATNQLAEIRRNGINRRPYNLEIIGENFL